MAQTANSVIKTMVGGSVLLKEYVRGEVRYWVSDPKKHGRGNSLRSLLWSSRTTPACLRATRKPSLSNGGVRDHGKKIERPVGGDDEALEGDQFCCDCDEHSRDTEAAGNSQVNVADYFDWLHAIIWIKYPVADHEDLFMDFVVAALEARSTFDPAPRYVSALSRALHPPERLPRVSEACGSR
jgi:hypothetical protein